jgi:hypothetical protein
MELFTGTVTDEQGVKYTANGDGTCRVSGHEDSYTASIDIPKVFQGNFVTSIGDGAFSRCSGLTSITIPNSVTSIGANAFYGCIGLTEIISLATTAPTIASATFSGVKTGGTLYVPSGSSGYNTWMGTGNYYLGKYNWTKVEQ